MKITSGIPALVLALGILLSSGCKKDTPYYPSQATLNDYTGSWEGSLTTFKNNHLITTESTILLYFPAGSDRLEGMITLDKVYALSEIQIRNGIYYFTVLNSDTANPYCQNWNLSGYGQLSAADKMHIIISGKECGEVGKEWVNYEGDFILSNVSPDSSSYFSFGGMGHHWTYEVLTLNGDSCGMEYDVTAATGTLNTGTITSDCNFGWGSQPLRWDVAPFHFQVLAATGKQVQYAFHIDQAVNVPYYYYTGMDTSIVTLLSTDSMYVAAGGFLCQRYLLERRLHTDSTYRLDKGILSISNRYGIIRYQSTLLNDINDIVNQELTQKNF